MRGVFCPRKFKAGTRTFPDAVVTLESCNLVLKNLGKFSHSFAFVDNIHYAFDTNVTLPAKAVGQTPVYLECLV
jgi:hypothetical protein